MALPICKTSLAARVGQHTLRLRYGRRVADSDALAGAVLPTQWTRRTIIGFGLAAPTLAVPWALLLLLLAAAMAARKARRVAIDEFDRALAQALLASVIAGACGFAFFDTFAFPQAAGCFFLLLGMAGGMRRLALSRANADQAVPSAPMTPHTALVRDVER